MSSAGASIPPEAQAVQGDLGRTPPFESAFGGRTSGSETPSPGEESVGSAAAEADDDDDTSGYWLLCAVICSGKGLYVGDGQIGDLFCMLHTSDGVCRSRTAVTGMVYSNANPSWPSNGNGNAFVLPVRRSKRQTDLVITVWDGSESLEEAIPVGKVHVSLTDFMKYPALPPGKETNDDAPPRYDFDVDLVPRLSALSEEQAQLTIMLERASQVFEGDGAKDQALHDLLRRLGIARKRERLKKLMQWDREYNGNGQARKGSGGVQDRDYSLVSLLTADPAHGGGSRGRTRAGGHGLLIPNAGSRVDGGQGEMRGDSSALHDGVELEEVMEQLSMSFGEGEGGSRMAAVPVRAQAALVARIKHVVLQDGSLVMERGTAPTSFFYIVSGSCCVTIGGVEVNRLQAGEFLGEIGVIYESARVADVRAIGDTEVLVLDSDDISLALDMFPGLYRELQRVAEMRFAHVQSRQTGADAAFLKRPIVEVDDDNGPLAKFLAFLNNVATENKAGKAAHGRSEHPSRMAVMFPGPQAPVYEHMASRLPLQTLDDLSKLDSINEAEAAAPLPATHAHLSDHLHEQALSARLASMEQSGVFGHAPGNMGVGMNGISIPAGKKRSNTSPTDGSSLRVAMFKNVGSLEQARKGGGPNALSPMGKDWDRSSGSSGSDGSESDESGDESDSENPNSDAGSDPSKSVPTYGSLSDSIPPAPSGQETGRQTLQESAGDEKPKKGENERGCKRNKPRPRKSMFRIRFRKAHDTYTAEELGATPRRLRRMTVSGVHAQNLKEHDIQAYYTIEAAPAAGETSREPLLQVIQSRSVPPPSEVARGDKVQQEVAWNQPVTLELEDQSLFSDQRICVAVYQKRQLWSTRLIGYAYASLRDAFARPGVSMQSTYQLFKDKNEAEKRSRSKTTEAAASAAAAEVGSKMQASSSSSSLSTMPRSWSGGNLFRRASKTEEDEDGIVAVRGHVTMTWLVEDTIKLPFCLSVPPLRSGQCSYDIIDHLGVVVAKIEYLGRSRCAWCTKSDPSAAFFADYTDAEAGPQEEPCCHACAMKGWSECVVMWDKHGTVRLGSVFTDVTPRKHSRARICDQNDTHFASVRAACTVKPEISTGVRFKIVPTFSELSIKACGSIVSGKTCSASFQVSERRPEAEESKEAAGAKLHRRACSSRVGDVVSDINRGGGARDPANVLVQAGKDAVRSVLIAIGIDEACRLRPRAVYDGVTFRDKFDKEYQRDDDPGEVGQDSHPSPHGSPFQSPR